MYYKFFRTAQSKNEVLEWIPYNRLQNVEQKDLRLRGQIKLMVVTLKWQLLKSDGFLNEV